LPAICYCLMQLQGDPSGNGLSAWQQSLTKVAHVACCTLQEGVAEEDIVSKLADGVDALRPVLAEAQERGFRRGPAAPLLRAEQPTWADFYLLPPLADLVGIPEGSILQGALSCGSPHCPTGPCQACALMLQFCIVVWACGEQKLLHVAVAYRLIFVRLWLQQCGLPGAT